MIRERAAGDLPALIRGLRVVHDLDAYPSVWPAAPLAFIAPPFTLGAWVAVAHGEVVGQVILRAVPLDHVPTWVQATGLQPADVAVLSRLFVAPAGRGLGLARQLFQVAWLAAEDLGKQAILDVHQKNKAAIQLYDRQGWQQVATVTGDWLDPDGSIPCVHVYVAPLRAGH